MNFKKSVSVLLCITILLSLCGCSRGDGKKRISVIVKSVNSDFFKNLKNGAYSAATEYNVALTFEGPESEEDFETQNEMINNAVEKGADAIVLSAIDYEKAVSAVENAARKGVKIVTIDSDVNSSAVSLFIGTDNREAGKAAAEAAVSAFDESTTVNIGLVNYFTGTDNGIQREEGFREYIKTVSNARIIAAVNVESNVTSATAGAISLLHQYPQINVLVGFNEWTTLGVGNAINQTGSSDKICGVGFDTNIISVEMIETGEMNTLIVQNPFAIGYLGVQKAAALISGEAVGSGDIHTAVTAVTKDNIFNDDIQKILFSFNWNG